MLCSGEIWEVARLLDRILALPLAILNESELSGT